ncbi:murein hydrolase activator EnvC family protein [Endomicrobium proavitum]|uniref:NlpD-like lipoprotein n=1 Tax=Endomicrobium proavitum TaxID=1408281 RepID=A0A0G3WI22_9BACT|nr:peptidoglycan DD-metalloendopeptidase family protein [Endomicrobium proavitum]AKL97512.1 NlpD-like lipoprotein [Endomicrobium proavitum]
MKIRIVAFTFACLFFFCCEVFAKQAGVQSQSAQLSDVNKKIQAKKLEKNKLMLQEKNVKRELKNLNDSIARNEKRLQKISGDIKIAEGNLATASKQYNNAFAKSAEVNKKMRAELELFHKQSMSLSYETDPVEYKIRKNALEAKKANFEKERIAASVSAAAVKKWNDAKKELLRLQDQEDSLAAEKRNLIKEKNELLKTTAGKRAEAEEEIKTLNENAKALQALIKQLSSSKRKKSNGTVIRASTPKHKKNLPWPVEGKVVAQFGKSKHPEMDTYIISNGIKIKASDYAKVKSVDSGTVIFAGNFRSYGKVVIIDHNDSTFSVYGQLDKILVTDEQKVSKGSTLAQLGAGQENVLYFEIRNENIADNPMLWLK